MEIVISAVRMCLICLEVKQLRYYLPVEEVAMRLSALISQPEPDGVLNCCSGTPISVWRLVEERIKERDSTIKLNLGYYPYPDYEPMAFWGKEGF